MGRYTNEVIRRLLEGDSTNEYVLFYQEEAQLGYFGRHANAREIVVRSPVRMIWDQVAIPLAARRERCDVLFNPKLSVPLWSPCKTVFVVHGADWFMFPQNYPLLDRIYHRYFMALYIRRATAIISISDNATDLLLKKGLVARDKVATIHHGVDDRFRAPCSEEEIQRVRERYKLPDRFILFVGQIYPMKNLSGVIRAFAQQKGRLPHKLVIVGKPLLKYRREVDLVKKLGLSSEVVFTGFVPDQDLPALYHAADLFLFPSLYEGFGIPLLEAMASGCPVVTSNRGSCPEVVGDAALIVDPRDDRDIADAVYRLATDEKLRLDLREKGLQRIQNFTWGRTAQQTLSLLTSLVALSS